MVLVTNLINITILSTDKIMVSESVNTSTPDITTVLSESSVCALAQAKRAILLMESGRRVIKSLR